MTGFQDSLSQTRARNLLLQLLLQLRLLLLFTTCILEAKSLIVVVVVLIKLEFPGNSYKCVHHSEQVLAKMVGRA